MFSWWEIKIDRNLISALKQPLGCSRLRAMIKGFNDIKQHTDLVFAKNNLGNFIVMDSNTSTKDIKGIKGWLLFFGVVFVLLFPFNSFANVFSPAFELGLSSDRILLTMIEILTGLSSLATGILIFFKHQRALKTLNIFLVFYFLQSIYIHTLSFVNRGETLKFLIVGILYTVVIILVIAAYFRNSKRVRNTLIN